MVKQRFARILKYGAIVCGLYAVGAWTAAWLMDGDIKWGIVDRSGKVIVPLVYEDMGESHNGLVPVSLDGKWGLIDASGKAVLELQYGRIEWSGSGWLVKSFRPDHDWNAPTGWADANGKLILAPEYQSVRAGGAAVKKDDRWTLRDERGAVVAAGRFDTIREFQHGLAPAGQSKNLGIIDRKGKWLIEPKFADVYVCGENCVLGQIRSKGWRFYDRNGRERADPPYMSVSELGHGYYRATTPTKRSLVFHTSGGRAIEIPFQDMRGFSDGRAAFKSDGKWGFLDPSGKVVVKPAYENARRSHEGVAAVQAGKSWHLIDAAGAKIGAGEYEHIGEFSRGLALAQGAGGNALIDTSGKAVFSLGENWMRLLDASGKPLGSAILHQGGVSGRQQPVVLSADAIGVKDFPPHVRAAASLFSFGSDYLTGNIETLANVAAMLAVLSMVGAFFLGPAPAGRFMRFLGGVHAFATTPAARTVVRRTAKGVGYLALFVVGVVLILVAINLPDEKLNPEVAAYLQQDPRKQAADAQNGYFYFVGIAAKDNPHAAGMKYVAELNDVQAKRLKGERVEWPKEFDKLTLADPRICATENVPCLSLVAENEADARRIVSESKVLLERYRALLDYPAYAETQQLAMIDTPLVSFQPLTYGQRAYLVAAALKVRQGQTEAALADVEKSLAFSRRMLAGSRTLIGRMVAAAQIQRSALFLSEILQARRGSVAAGAARLDRTLLPFSEEERQLGGSLRAEFGLLAPLASGAACRQGQLGFFGPDDNGILSRLPCVFLQPNATLNLAYVAWHKPFVEIDAAPAQKFEQVLSERRPAKPPVPGIDAVYNPVGKLMIAVGGADWSEYTASMHDRDGIVRLVALQALIAAKRVSNADVPKFAAQAGSRYHDPYTGAPMRWDAARGQIYFEPKSTRVKRIAADGRLGVRL